MTPFYKTCAADAAVLALLGDPPAIFPWGENTGENRQYPYVTFQTISGSPENFLSGRPDADHFTQQIDVWGMTGKAARDVALAIRDAVELDCYITSWRGGSRDAETGAYRYSFDIEWITQR